MNTLTQYFVPEWVSILFLVAITLPFIMITLFVKKETQGFQTTAAWKLVLSFFVIYLAYISFASYQGWFNRVSLPPKVLLLTTFPYAFLLFIVVANTSIYKKIFDTVSLESLIRLHVFRMVGVFFVILALHDALPKAFAMIAGFGDMITAFSSIFVANAITEKKPYARKLAYAWNIFGTIDIIFTAVAANVLTKISIDTGAMGVDTLATFPFCIIPAFAPPTILFLHWSIFKKLSKSE